MSWRPELIQAGKRVGISGCVQAADQWAENLSLSRMGISGCVQAADQLAENLSLSRLGSLVCTGSCQWAETQRLSWLGRGWGPMAVHMQLTNELNTVPELIQASGLWKWATVLVRPLDIDNENWSIPELFQAASNWDLLISCASLGWWSMGECY